MIDKDSSTPMYEQIASQLKQEILEQKFGAGGNIGAHTQLAKRFGVSLITVRKAVQLLADQGLLNVAQGKGTFVKNTALQDNLTRLTGASNIIWESRLSAQIQAPIFEIIDTPASFDSDIRQGLGEKCLHIQRIHLVEGSPIAYAEIYIPQKYGEQLSKADVEQYTIYQLYENKWKVQLGRGKQTIRADRASPIAAKALQIPEGWPVLSILRRAYSASGQLVEYMLMNYEYTKYSFDVELSLSSK
ncbi:MAG: GntR family transcriptional regulator [Clostridiaceae bacterium]|nr:GntR family transcriptional regulator [Clostridiaceae bacterium]